MRSGASGSARGCPAVCEGVVRPWDPSVPLKGSGGSSPSCSYPPLTCAFPVSTAVMEPDAESSVAWILPVPWSLEYAPVPFFNTKRPFISEVVALVDLMPPLN